MKILIDMNLSPGWVKVLREAGWESTHWSMVGDMRAPAVLEKGALLTVDEGKSRIRILPFE